MYSMWFYVCLWLLGKQPCPAVRHVLPRVIYRSVIWQSLPHRWLSRHGRVVRNTEVDRIKEIRLRRGDECAKVNCGT